MILYPTETIYALGVAATDEVQIAELFALKGRPDGKAVSWAVRDIEDIEQYAVVDDVAKQIIEQWLPGSLTVVLRAKDTVPAFRRGVDNEISFRILPDPVGQQVVVDFMNEHDVPLTCTSANVSGMPTLPTPAEIAEQFRQYHGANNPIDWTICDDGPRTGVASTVVRIVDGELTILREGAIPVADIFASLH